LLQKQVNISAYCTQTDNSTMSFAKAVWQISYKYWCCINSYDCSNANPQQTQEKQ